MNNIYILELQLLKVPQKFSEKKENKI